MNNNKTLLAIAGIGLVIAVAIAVTRGAGKTAPTDSIEMTTQETTITSAPSSEGMSSASSESSETTSAGEVRLINMEAGSFYYTPKEIKVKKGERVKIVMTSKDMMHDFNIPELNVKIPITKAGDSATVEFVADKVGQFEYFCSVGQHRKNGQVGMLIVE